MEALTSAVPALQAIGTAVAPKLLTVAPARDQRVIAIFAEEPNITAVPALQAIGTASAIEALKNAPTRDQRVIPIFAK